MEKGLVGVRVTKKIGRTVAILCSHVPHRSGRKSQILDLLIYFRVCFIWLLCYISQGELEYFIEQNYITVITMNSVNSFKPRKHINSRQFPVIWIEPIRCAEFKSGGEGTIWPIWWPFSSIGSIQFRRSTTISLFSPCFNTNKLDRKLSQKCEASRELNWKHWH